MWALSCSLLAKGSALRVVADAPRRSREALAKNEDAFQLSEEEDSEEEQQESTGAGLCKSHGVYYLLNPHKVAKLLVCCRTLRSTMALHSVGGVACVKRRVSHDARMALAPAHKACAFARACCG